VREGGLPPPPFEPRDLILLFVALPRADIGCGNPVEEAPAVRAEVRSIGRGAATVASLTEKLLVAPGTLVAIHVTIDYPQTRLKLPGKSWCLPVEVSGKE
jgi:hypothetical protein